MPISKRGDSFQVSITINGRRVRKTFRDRFKAQQYEAEVKADLMAGREPKDLTKKSKRKGVPLTVGGMADHIYEMEWKFQKAADHTYNRVQKVVDYFGESTPLEAVDAFSLEAYTLHLRNKEGNGPSTINRKMAIISKILGYAHRHQVIKFKPHIKSQREPDGRIKYYTNEEEAALNNKMLELSGPGNNFGCVSDFFTICIDTGMRRGECLSVEWEDVDFEKRQVVLPDPDMIKAALPRSIPMTTRVYDILSRRKLDKSKRRRPFMFTSHQLDFQVQRFKDEVVETGEKYMDIEDVPLFHTCRHTFISRLLQKGVPLTTVRELAGHRDISTTMRYAHLSPNNHTDAISLLEKEA